MPSLREQFSVILDRAFDERGLLLKDVAETTGRREGSISNIRSGKKNTTLDTLDELLGVAGVEVEVSLVRSTETPRAVKLLQEHWEDLSEEARATLTYTVEAMIQRELGPKAQKAVS